MMRWPTLAIACESKGEIQGLLYTPIISALFHLTFPAMDTSQLIYSPKLWLENGDVVLKADNTVFRVTRGILAYHSPVFLKMVIHSESHIYLGGCKVLTLPDSADDVTPFLRAIHDPA